MRQAISPRLAISTFLNGKARACGAVMLQPVPSRRGGRGARLMASVSTLPSPISSTASAKPESPPDSVSAVASVVSYK